MLLKLNIKNFAIIEDIEINFKENLNILTGETGAGKSIVIDAVSAILGEQLGEEYIKSGKSSACIQALFEVKDKELEKFLSEAGVYSGENLIIEREIFPKKNYYRINGKLVNSSLVKKISQKLIDIHGQNQHNSLLYPENHLILFDEFAGKEVKILKKEVSDLFDEFRNLKKEREKLKLYEREREREIEIKKFQIEEIEKANLKEGEDVELKNRKEILTNFEKIFSVLKEAYLLLYGEENTKGSAFENIGISLNLFKGISNLREEFKEIYGELENLYFRLQEICYNISKLKEEIYFSPEELNEIEERLNLLKNLKRKYGENISEILNYLKILKKEYEELINYEEKSKEIEKKILEFEKVLREKVLRLSELRKKYKSKFEKDVLKELKDLAMENCRFEVNIYNQESEEGIEINGKKYLLGESGLDKIEFLISPNPGEDLKPLAKIASGGELSRIMLALKKVLSRVDPVPLMIFDEIDAGISGKAANKIGEKLKEISKSHQVICVTHLPIIASFANNHILVEKEIAGNKTTIKVKELDKKGRVKELARMLRGESATEITLKDAEELLKIGEKI
jgi:DNA repair protein RecN (Recombination protein N)